MYRARERVFTSFGLESSCVPIIKLLFPSDDLMAERQRAYIGLVVARDGWCHDEKSF